MRIIYCHGSDELSSWDIEEIEKDNDFFSTLIVNYRHECYEGYGYAIGIDKFGVAKLSSLSHCSCYGPGENQFNLFDLNTADLDASSIHSDDMLIEVVKVYIKLQEGK